jgi:hypothetical protein
MADVPAKLLATGFGIGALVVFVAVLLIALALGVGAVLAFLVAIFVGLVAGGSVGFLVAGRRSQSRR